jgi:hypothetical protein
MSGVLGRALTPPVLADGDTLVGVMAPARRRTALGWLLTDPSLVMTLPRRVADVLHLEHVLLAVEYIDRTYAGWRPTAFGCIRRPPAATPAAHGAIRDHGSVGTVRQAWYVPAIRNRR